MIWALATTLFTALLLLCSKLGAAGLAYSDQRLVLYSQFCAVATPLVVVDG